MGKDLFNYMEKIYGKRLKRAGTVWWGLKVTREDIVETIDDI